MFNAYELTGTEITHLAPRRSILKQAIGDILGITAIILFIGFVLLLGF